MAANPSPSHASTWASRSSGFPLVVLLDGGDLGEKLPLDVLGQAVGVGEFDAGEEAVHLLVPSIWSLAPACRRS